MGCYIWYSKEGPGRAAAPPSPLIAVPNVTAHPSTASVPITVLLYDDPLLCGFNVAIERLTRELFCANKRGFVTEAGEVSHPPQQSTQVRSLSADDHLQSHRLSARLISWTYFFIGVFRTTLDVCRVTTIGCATMYAGYAEA